MSLSKEQLEELRFQASRPVPTVTTEDLHDLLTEYDALVAKEKHRQETVKRIKSQMKKGEPY